tara:strand:+ start:140 stop:1948 length:1809 start_codon:yes stop_codon:yes gene_type:complete
MKGEINMSGLNMSGLNMSGLNMLAAVALETKPQSASQQSAEADFNSIDLLDVFKKDTRPDSLNQLHQHLKKYQEEGLFEVLCKSDQGRINELINSLACSALDLNTVFESIKNCLNFDYMPAFGENALLKTMIKHFQKVNSLPNRYTFCEVAYNHCRDILDFVLTQTLFCLAKKSSEQVELFVKRSDLLDDARFSHVEGKWTPLSKAVKYGFINVVEFFLEKGADPDKKIRETVTKIEESAMYDNLRSITLDLETESPITLALQHKLNIRYGITSWWEYQPKRAREMVDLLLKYHTDITIQYKSAYDCKINEEKSAKPLYQVSKCPELNRLMYSRLGNVVDTKDYAVPDFDQYTSVEFNQQLQKMLDIKQGESVEKAFGQWIGDLIENGVNDEDISMIWKQGLQFAKYFLTNFVVLPKNERFNSDYLAHGFMNRDYLTQNPSFKFVEPDAEFKLVSQLMNNGTPLFEGQENLYYHSNTNVGNFLGQTKTKKKQGVIANIIWLGIFCKKHNLTQDQIGKKLTRIIEPEFPSITTCSSQTFAMDPKLSWNSDYELGGQTLYGGIGTVVEKYGIIQSPYVRDGKGGFQKNKYFVPFETILKLSRRK